jgi:hypothetical protein
MRGHKQGDSPSDYPRDVYPLRPRHGLTVGEISRAQGERLTELNDRSVRLGGGAISLMDPRDIAGQVVFLASVLQQSVVSGGSSSTLADDLGAQVLALRLAMARSEHDRIDTGGEAA